MLDTRVLDELIAKVTASGKIPVRDIPDIDLYMDQVTTFMDNKFMDFKRGEKDKILTKSMINNYAKAGILIPPNKKKYSKENMILLILIYRLKQVISINDISHLFTGLIDRQERETSFLENVYELFLQLEDDREDDFKKLVYDRAATIEAMPKNIANDEEEQLQWFLLALILISEAEAEKRLAEKIIDTYFNK